MSHRAAAGDEQVRDLVVEVLDAVVDHDVGVPHLVRAEVDRADVLVVGGRPLQPRVSPPHHEPHVAVERGLLRVHVQVQRHHVQAQGHAPGVGWSLY